MTKPTDRARDVFETCSESRIDPDIRGRLIQLAPQIEAAETGYETAASNSLFFTLRATPSASAAEARAVYAQRFQPEGSLGRNTYDRLILSAPNRLCPLCGAGFVETLDHYLPKTPFWEMALMPINLVPSCPHCNHAKHSAIPTSEEEQTIHPYYDDFDDEVWLVAIVSEIDPVAVTYDVVEPARWSPTKRARARKHFYGLKLSDLYISRAGTELSENKQRYWDMHAKGDGAQRVRDHLEEQLHYLSLLPFRNDWKTALYRALSSSDWFCERGCLLVGEP